MPSLLPSAATDGARRPTSHFRVQTAEYSSSNETGVTATTTGGEDAALKDTIALLDRFALSTLTRAAAASAPSVLAVKLAVIERLASPFPEPASSAGSGSTRGETTELMRKALRVLDPSDWDDLIDERWAAGTCGFAACGDNPLTAPTDLGVAEQFLRETRQPRETYVPREERSSLRQSRLRNVRLRGGSLVQKNLLTHSDGDGEPHSDPGAFCSDRCRIQSEYYRSLAGRGREPDRSEMWDEVERRRVEVRNSTAALRREEEEEAAVASTSINLPGAAAPAAAEPRSPLHGHGIPSALSGEPSTTTPSAHRTADLTSFDDPTAAFLSTISIHEKPIRPETRPAAPSLATDANRDLERHHRQVVAATSVRPPATSVGGSLSTRPRASGTLGGEDLDVAVTPGRIGGGGGGGGASSSSSSNTAAETGGGGAYSLPPIRFLTRPREVTSSMMSGGGSSSSRGSRSDFAAGGGARYDQDEEEEDEFAHGPVLEGIDEEHVRWLEAALLEREASAP